MAEILNFPSKNIEKENYINHQMQVDEHKQKLRSLYVQLEHILKEINHYKQILKDLEK